MARVNINLPQRFIFSMEIPLRTSDINYGGHLGHDSVLSLTQEARAAMLAKYGFTEENIDGPGLIIADAALEYKSEAFYGDVLVIDVAVGDWGRKGCDIYYRITNKATGREVARAKTGIVFFDYRTRKPALVPERFRQIVLEEERRVGRSPGQS